MKLKYILPLLILLPILSACNQSDDVIEIFTKNKWKLTGVFYDKGNKGNDPEWCMDYWNDNQAAWEASNKIFKKDDTFIIVFSGVEDGDEVIGSYNGYAANSSIKGNWKANGKNNSFSTSGQAAPGGNEDILGKAYINALINADKYEGDVNNLRIYFEDPQKKDRRYLMFHAAN